MYPLFTTAMALREVDPGAGSADAVFDAELNEHWTIGPKVHGGAMLALCANAARTAYARAPGDAAGRVASAAGAGQSGPGAAGVQPVAVSASFLWAPDPGPMRLATSMRKRGRRISVVDVELTQGGRTAVHAVVTLGEPEHFGPRDDAGPQTTRAGLPGRLHRAGHPARGPLLAANPVVDLMPPDPPDEVAPIGPGHPMSGLVHLAAGCDVRPVVSTLQPSTDGRPPMIQMWVRPRGVAPDALFALMCGDVSAPVSFAVGRTGWAPTVQLTAYLRALPADGWLRVVCTCLQIGQDWFDEDHIVVDCDGRLVVQTRQLAMVPPR
ncbi:thioesterase family protein [Mycobacterium botniense]|uniref:DAGKc domain-containing protein n=1 Tax=Mycobacterium botniense TaxID=84962 RepID=A0A7I9XTR8_9MYCO|nr:thioesterase family protein [Mycobacterium botniense]GFG73384.1 hypothetical protein MBOT_07490 [Mycobacterium botniense]